MGTIIVENLSGAEISVAVEPWAASYPLEAGGKILINYEEPIHELSFAIIEAQQGVQQTSVGVMSERVVVIANGQEHLFEAMEEL